MVRRSSKTEKLSDIEENHAENLLSNEEVEENNTYDDLELDALFDKLKENTNIKANKKIDELSKIKESVKNLPKLQEESVTLSGLVKTDQEYLRSAQSESHSKRGIARINDTIIVRKKKDAEKIDAGDKWFNMPKGELTKSVKRDIRIIQNRAALDPKRHYKKGRWATPDYFQVGTIVESSSEFFSSRLNKKDRHETILDSVLQDQDTKGYFKRKYEEIQIKKRSGKKGDFKKLREGRKKY